jgi:small subunit ribosomal protein S20
MAKLKTGRHTSALKANRQASVNAARNTAQRSKMRTIVKKLEAAVAKKDAATAKDLLKVAFSEWDKASKKNVIHDNSAANQKARLSKLVASIAG